MTTVGALKKRGWHGLQLHCRPCNTVHVLIWAYLRQPDDMPIERITLRLRCRKSGTRPGPDGVKPYYLDTGKAEGAGEPPGDRSPGLPH